MVQEKARQARRADHQPEISVMRMEQGRTGPGGKRITVDPEVIFWRPRALHEPAMELREVIWARRWRTNLSSASLTPCGIMEAIVAKM